MKKWKAEIWITDDYPGEKNLTKRDMNNVIKIAKKAIEREQDGLKVTVFDVHEDKESEQ